MFAADTARDRADLLKAWWQAIHRQRTQGLSRCEVLAGRTVNSDAPEQATGKAVPMIPKVPLKRVGKSSDISRLETKQA